VWVEDAGGAFVKTIGRWANVRKGNLVAWTTAAGANDVDAVSGATRQNHTGTLTVTWDLKNRGGTVVPDGTYTIRMELTDKNTSSAATNNQGTFTFVKGATPQSQTGLTSGGFSGVAITFSPTGSCNNGVVDVGETCDGNCPTACAASGDACAPNTLVGDAALCTAACMPSTITACATGDGCCPAGCEGMDADCDASPDVQGGCATTDRGGTAPVVLGGLLLGLVMLRRRRRR